MDNIYFDEYICIIKNNVMISFVSSLCLMSLGLVTGSIQARADGEKEGITLGNNPRVIVYVESESGDSVLFGVEPKRGVTGLFFVSADGCSGVIDDTDYKLYLSAKTLSLQRSIVAQNMQSIDSKKNFSLEDQEIICGD